MTEKQRQFIIKRDGHQCSHISMLPSGPRRCFVTVNLEVHHILSRRFMSRWFPEENPDRPNNMITLCVFHHRMYVHPDIEEAFATETDKELQERIEAVTLARDVMVAKGIPYWNTQSDGLYAFVACQNNLKCNDSFPEKASRKRKEVNVPLGKSVSKNMRELYKDNKKKGKAKGANGKPRSRKQMIAIAMSAAGKSKKGKK